MHVLIIAFNIEEECIRLASGLVGKVEAVSLVLPERAAAPHLHLLDDRVRLHTFHKPRLRQVFQQIQTMMRLVRYIRKVNPDVIHFQMGHLWFNLSLPLLSKFPLVTSIHDPRYHLGDRESRMTPFWIRDLAYHRADRCITHNEAMKSEAVRELRIPAEKIDIIPLIASGHVEMAASVVEDEHLVLFHGRIWKYKGLEYFIRAQPIVNAAIPEARFVIAGRGDDMTPFREMMEDASRFEVHDYFIPVEFREELVARSAVVVLPYIEATQSGVIPLAYAHGKPVVATNVGGLPSQVEDGVTGFLVPPADAAALADRIILLLQDSRLRRRLGENARRRQAEEWSGDTVAAQSVPIYQRTIETARSRRGRSASR